MRISDWSSDVCSSDLLGLAIDLEVAFAKAGLVGCRDGDGENVPACEIVRRGEFKRRIAALVGAERWVPIGDVFRILTELEIGAAISAGVRALLFKLLTTDKLQQQIVVEIGRAHV